MFFLQKESEFLDEYKDVAFIIGAPEFLGAKSEDDDRVNVLMICIAYKDIETNYIEKNKKIVVRMKIDEKDLDYYKSIIKRESVVKFKVRYEKEQGEDLAEFLLSDIIESNYKDEDLSSMLEEYLKPIIYTDEILGDFLYNRAVGSFDKEIEWVSGNKILTAFDDSDEFNKDKAAMFFRNIYLNKDEFDTKLKDYAAKIIIKQGNEASGKTIDADAFIREFMSKIKLMEIIVHEVHNYVNYRLGNKKVFPMDVIVEGDLNLNFSNAFISRF